MGTTRQEISEWLKHGKAQGATPMTVVCDTFNHEDYPVYVMPGEDAQARRDMCNDSEKMSRVMEVYSYARDLDEQLAAPRAHNIN